MTVADQPEEMVKVCACGCNRPYDEVYNLLWSEPGWLSPDQAVSGLRSKLIPRSEVQE